MKILILFILIISNLYSDTPLKEYRNVELNCGLFMKVLNTWKIMDRNNMSVLDALSNEAKDTSIFNYVYRARSEYVTLEVSDRILSSINHEVLNYDPKVLVEIFNKLTMLEDRLHNVSFESLTNSFKSSRIKINDQYWFKVPQLIHCMHEGKFYRNTYYYSNEERIIRVVLKYSEEIKSLEDEVKYFESNLKIKKYF